jgi:hypothetical protein
MAAVRNFASEGALRFVENILCRNLDSGVCQVLLDQEQVDCRWSNDDFNGGVNLCRVDGFDKRLGAGEQAICSTSKKHWNTGE